MKKIFAIIILLTLITPCYGQVPDEQENNDTQKEIYLYGTPQKGYNLKNKDYRNNPDLDNHNDEEDMSMPIDWMPTPLRLLKQYQEGNF